MRRSLMVLAMGGILLVGVAVARAAGEVQSPSPPPDRDSAGAHTPCPNEPGTICGAPDLSAHAAAQQARATLRRNRVRRGTTLPTLRKLFGRRGQRAARRADAWILRRMGAGDQPQQRRVAGARASAKLQKVGRVGHVRIDAGVDGDIASGDEEIREEVLERDRLRAGRVRQIRYFRYSAVAGVCPDPGNPRETHGKVEGRLRAEQKVTTVQRRGHRVLTTTLSIELGGPEKIEGLVDTWANLYEIWAHDPDGIVVRISRKRTVRNLRTKRVAREKPIKLDYEWRYIDPAQISQKSDFEAFIRRALNEKHPADDFQSDRMLREGAFDALAKQFAVTVGARVRALYERQEQAWRTPNRCLRLDWDPPERMRARESREVRVEARSNEGYTTEQLARRAGYMAMSRESPLEVKPYIWDRPDEQAGKTYTIIAPTARWDGALRVIVDYYGKAGVAMVSAAIRAADTAYGGNAKVTITYDGLTETYTTSYTLDPIWSRSLPGGGTESYFATPKDHSRAPDMRASWRISGTDGSGCTHSGEASWKQGETGLQASLTLRDFGSGDSRSEYTHDFGIPFKFAQVRRVCPDFSETYPHALGSGSLSPESRPWNPGSEGITGSHSETHPGPTTIRQEWTLRPVTR